MKGGKFDSRKDAIDSIPPKNEVQDLSRLSEEEFSDKYYQGVIPFEKLLKKAGSKLKLYHTETGYPIKLFEKKVGYVKVKKRNIIYNLWYFFYLLFFNFLRYVKHGRDLTITIQVCSI